MLRAGECAQPRPGRTTTPVATHSCTHRRRCAQVSNINTANINDQTYDEVDEELRKTAWYKELERQMEEERLRRVAAEEERARRQAEAEAKAAAEAEAKAAKKGGKKKKK